ncbi:MAG: Eco57I restriction-modification methylase domain-containing protein, partial [Polyangiaceae bacterium]
MAAPASQLRDAHYTPADVVDRMVDEALGPLLQGASFERGAAIQVLDPACGEGAFLLGAFRRLVRWLGARAPSGFDVRRHVVTHQLGGVDLDADALTRARHALCHAAGAALPLALHQGDSLVDAGGAPPTRGRNEPWRPFDYPGAFPNAWHRERPGFDAVVGNPPYVDSEHMVATRPGLRAHCRARYRAARGNWDLFCPFIERAVELTRIGGRHAFLVPGQLASADYAAGARTVLADHLRLDTILDYADASLFDAHVYPLAYVGERVTAPTEGEVRWEQGPHTARLPVRGFSERPWPRSELSARLAAAAHSTHGELAVVSGAATVSEAYDLLPLLDEAPRPARGDLRIVNSGTLDPHRSLWGRRPMRYLKHRFAHPVVRRARQGALPPRRLAQARSPKLVVASMTRRLEACVDDDGDLLAAKSTSVIQLRDDAPLDLWSLSALLHSDAMTRIYQELYGGLRLSGGYLRVGPSQLRQLPIPLPSPSQRRRLSDAARRLASEDDPNASAT